MSANLTDRAALPLAGAIQYALDPLREGLPRFGRCGPITGLPLRRKPYFKTVSLPVIQWWPPSGSLRDVFHGPIMHVQIILDKSGRGLYSVRTLNKGADMATGKWTVKVAAGRWMAGVNRFRTLASAEKFRSDWLKAEKLQAASDGIISFPTKDGANKYAEQMRRWSDEKLDKELSFAQAARDNADTQNLAWLEACERENDRRATKALSA